MKRIAIGNFDYRDERIVDGKVRVDITKRYKNEYYHSENSLKDDGWVFDSDGCASKDNMHIHSSLFENEYQYVVVATVEWNRNHDEFNVCSSGMRAFTLSDEDFEDFKKLLELIYDMEVSRDE